jgi:hypothetical protein
LAFSISNFDGAHPTIDTLRILENKEFENSIPVVNMDKDQLDESITESSECNMEDDEYVNVFDSYVPVTPKVGVSY